MTKMNLLVNLPAGFFAAPRLTDVLESMNQFATVTRTSCNSAAEILPDLQKADAVLMWSWPRLTEELLDQCPMLKFSANIDISQTGARTLLERGIPISVSRRGFSPAVAEMALALMLATLRRTSNHHAAMWQRTEKWVIKFPDDIAKEERQLTGRKVGIIGFGAVGQRLAELLVPFKCPIQIYDPFLPESVSADFGVQSVSLDSLVAAAEVVILCAAANSGSKYLLEQTHIEALQKGAVLVNVARAALVDNNALLERLKRGDLYAALDVFDKEPLEADSELRSLPNVYLTPHRAGGIMESVVRIIAYLAEDLYAFHVGSERKYALTEAMLPSLDG